MTIQSVEIVVSESNNYIIEVGVQGPPGPRGPSGDGTGTGLLVQTSEPLSGATGDMWFSDETNVLKIYVNGVWTNQTQDDQFY